MEDPTDTPNDDATSNGAEVAVDLSSLGLSELGEALYRMSVFDAAGLSSKLCFCTFIDFVGSSSRQLSVP